MDERENIINESVTPSAVQPSQNNSLKKIAIILCVVCSVIGGLFGGIISGNIVRKKAEKEKKRLKTALFHIIKFFSNLII